MRALVTPDAHLVTSITLARASHESWYRERDNPFYSSDSVDDSYDSEAYPLSSQTAPFTEPFTTASRPGSWTSPTPTRGDPAGVPRWDAGDARTPSTWTHTSAHARHPHTVSIKLPRPVSKHLAFAPRRLPAARTYDVELQVRPRDPRNRDRDRSLREKRHRLARSRGENQTPTRTFPHTQAPHSPLLLPHTFLLGRDPVQGQSHGGCGDCRGGVPRSRARTHPTGRRSRQPTRRTARSDGMVRGCHAVRPHSRRVTR